MKYFTRSFINGSWDASRRREAHEAYHRRLYDLGLSPALERLGEMDLHDAWITAVQFETGRLHMRLIRGDLQRGYASVSTTFTGARVSKESLQLLEKAVKPSKSEVLASELDKAKGGFAFRMLLWPSGEARWVFSRVNFQLKGVSGRSECD